MESMKKIVFLLITLNHTSIYYEIKLESHRHTTPVEKDKVIELSLFL